MTQEEKQFLSDFMEMINESAESNNTSAETELTKAIIEYVVDNGEALAPEICECQSNSLNEKFTGRYRLNAFDYSETTGILDLFGTVFYEGQSPVLPTSTAERMANDLAMTLHIAIDGAEAKKTYREKNPDIAEALDMMKSEYEQRHIELVRLFVLSNGFATEPLELEDGFFQHKSDKKEIPIEYHFWDMSEVLKAEQLRRNNQEILINFQEEYQTKLECVEAFDEVNNIHSYLTIMPAITLAKIYHNYKVRLIDKNVRNFLGGKIKVNNEMAKTIAESPELFFSYNNGISSTAANVEVKTDENGRKYISAIRNWHIVNGGQTTSTIYNAYRQKLVAPNLSKAFVAVKVSEVKENDTSPLVGNIAKFANSQTKIKDSDLSANAPYMLELEKQSRKEWTSDTHSTLWYFERLRGQFLTEKSQAGGVGTLKVKKFEEERPQSQRFNKTDIAKLEMAWMDKPYESCKGGEVCFDKFWKIIKDETPIVDETYFHNIVAKNIIYKRIDSLLKLEGNKGHASIICAYTLALLSLRSQQKLDLNYIWANQNVPDDLVPIIKDCIRAISDHIRLIGSDSSKNPQTESKRIDFWNNLQNKTLAISIPESVLIDESETITITEDQKRTIECAVNRGGDFWKNLSSWTRKDGRARMSIMEKKKIDHLAASIEHNKDIKAKLAEDCERSLRLAKDYGFDPDILY
ncbi:MAG: AIPR family protein [Bacteroidales bacterium]|nr:AIPR family protein [Bacteroidales bacterium]